VIQLDCLPYGVGHADEGVCLLVRLGPYRILLDCGLRDLSALTDLGGDCPADLVLCSHAHADHARGLLSLHQAFPELPIYSSEVTTQLLPLNWTDESDVPLFSHALPWRSPVEFQDGLTAELFPAGHLPGAAVILLTYTPPPTATESRSYTVLYTGDFFLSNSRLVEGLRLEELRGLQPDVLIVEGSYGTARYPHRRQQENQLAERISRAIAHNQSVLLPLPTLGLGQELLMLLRSHHLFTGRDIDIWVNGTVAAGCDAYLELLPSLPSAVQNFARHQPLFWDERVRPRVRHLDAELRSSIAKSPCIILTDLTVDLNQFCQPEDSWLVLLPQHISLQEGREVEGLLSQMTIETYLLAQHCDGPSTTQLIHNLRPQHVVFVHGAPNYLADLTGLEELHNRYHLHSPSAGSLVELPIGETFLQPVAPDNSYEGELAELGTVVTITLPDSVMADPRWRSLADTGLIEARWQGEELVLRGLHQRELLNQGSDRLSAWSDGSLRECCQNCRHCRGQRCWNPGSPLFNFKVTPDGYCPGFEVIPALSESLEERKEEETDI
jgi:Cft2 family RNA processing exonuclease